MATKGGQKRAKVRGNPGKAQFSSSLLKSARRRSGSGASHLNGRCKGYLFETNRNDRYSVRTIQSMVKSEAREAGIAKRVYPHLLRHSIATILLVSGEVPLDQVQKFLG